MPRPSTSSPVLDNGVTAAASAIDRAFIVVG
jgi:hypothetical protein